MTRNPVAGATELRYAPFHMGDTHAYAEVLAALADVARSKGIARVRICADAGTTFELEMGPPPVSAMQGPILHPISRPAGSTSEEKRARVSRYRDALEGAHVTGEYPELADYQLTPGDL